MARRYRKKGRHGKAKPSVVSMVPLVVTGMVAYDGYKAGGLSEAGNRLILATTGFNMHAGKMQIEYAIPFYGMLAGTYVAKKAIGISGVNKAMKGLPFRL